MTNCHHTSFRFSPVKRRQVEADFNGGNISSDVGVLLLSQVDRKLGLSHSVATAIGDERRQTSCEHTLEASLKLRIYALALGYEDLNDHQALRHDLALQTAVASDKALSSTSTLSSFENSANCGASRYRPPCSRRCLQHQHIRQHSDPVSTRHYQLIGRVLEDDHLSWIA